LVLAFRQKRKWGSKKSAKAAQRDIICEASRSDRANSGGVSGVVAVTGQQGRVQAENWLE